VSIVKNGFLNYTQIENKNGIRDVVGLRINILCLYDREVFYQKILILVVLFSLARLHSEKGSDTGHMFCDGHVNLLQAPDSGILPKNI
jgi:hypothetical protein